MTTKKILLGVAILLLVITGCQLTSDMFWPVRKTTQAKIYLGEDPNEAGGFESLGAAKDTHQAVIAKHIGEQLKAKHEMEKDKALYSLAIEQSNINIETAKAEKEAMIGTIEKPGWLTSILLGGSGFGLYLAGARKQRPEDKNPQEQEAAIKEAVEKVKNGQ